MKKTTSALEILMTSEVFRLLPLSDIQILEARAHHEQYEYPTLLVEAGQIQTHLRYIVSGRVDLTLSTKDGQMASLPLTAGKWISWLGCFNSTHHEVWASSNTTLISFPVGLVRQIISPHPEVLIKILEQVAVSMRTLVSLSLGPRLFTAEKRLAHVLLIAARYAHNDAQDNQQVTMTQEQIGILGLGTRQRVSRLLHAIAQKEIISLEYGRIIIPSRTRLEQFVFGDMPKAPSSEIL